MISRSVTLEFIGIPGAGKSSLTSGLTERLRASGISVDQRAYEIVHTRGTMRRLTSKCLRVAREVLLHPRLSAGALRCIRATKQRSCSDLFTVAFNWLFVLSLSREKRDAKICVRDQGILQALWSIGLFGDRESLNDTFTELLALTELPEAVVVVEVDADSAARRLRDRKTSWSRVDVRSSDPRLLADCVSLTDETRRLLHRLRQEHGKPQVIVVQNNDDVDLEDATERLTRLLEASIVGIRKDPTTATLSGTTAPSTPERESSRSA